MRPNKFGIRGMKSVWLKTAIRHAPYPAPRGPLRRQGSERRRGHQGCPEGGIGVERRKIHPMTAAGIDFASIVGRAATVQGKRNANQRMKTMDHSGGLDLQSLRSDLNSLKDMVTKFVSQSGSEVAKSAREVTSNVAGQVGDVASDLADKGAEMASAASKQAKTFGSELENMARRNPIGVIAGAVVIGVLIGMLARRS
jgi:ElaB/YqjD/DUF883 family membrane-anchored ribosome-binding protein